MALKFYQNYLNNMAKDPDSEYRGLMQASVDSQWDNTTQVLDCVQEQDEIGSDKYHYIDVHIDYAIEMGTGFKQDDDFKIFSFRDLIHKAPKGLMYQYDDDYWLVVNTGELGSVSNDVTIRRCNNMMRWVDKINGKVYEYPCIVEYVLESPQQLKDKEVITANGHITVMCQGDNITRYIPKNTRFIFNKQPFKLVAYQNMLNEGVKANLASNLLYLDMYLDMEEPDDDIENNIANKGLYQYTIEFEPSVESQVNGYVGRLIPIVKLNGVVVDRQVEYCCNQNAEIDKNGVFTLTGQVGSVAKFECWIKGNEDIYGATEIKIVELADKYYEIVVEPNINTLRVGKQVTIGATLYEDGVALKDEVTCVASGLDGSFYGFAHKHENIWLLSARKISQTPLTLTFTSNNIEKTIEIMLTSAF